MGKIKSNIKNNLFHLNILLITNKLINKKKKKRVATIKT